MILKSRARFYIFFILAIGILSSCGVSRKDWNNLEERVLLLQAPQIESVFGDMDGDGVPDPWDIDYGSDLDYPINYSGGYLDSDLDGVPDYKDVEIHSPSGYGYDSKGVALVPERDIITEDALNRIIDAKLSAFEASSPDDKIVYLPPQRYTLQLPLPTPSTYHRLSHHFAESVITFADVDTYLRSELDKAEFDVAPRYFLVTDPDTGENGFAIITPIEVTDENAYRRDWWAPGYDEHQINDLGDFFRIWRNTHVGYSRMMIILVTTTKILDSSTAIERMGGRDWIRDGIYDTYGMGLLSIDKLGISNEPIDRSTKPQFLIYEFRKPISSKRAKLQENVSYKKHLKGAKLDNLIDE